jgi:ectoine hydroxylase-related dioxygenase (phytanoyl-CoA dioxygenase family)
MRAGNDLFTTAEHRQTYLEDGVTVVRGAFGDEWLGRLREATDRAMSARGDLTREYDTNEGGRFHATTFLWLHDPDVKAFVAESPAAQIAAELMQSATSSFFFDHLLVKEPGTENPTPWHQDLPYWPVNGTQICSLWFAMDHVDVSNGGVRYVAGSHRWTTWFRAQSFGGSDKYSDMTMPEPPDPDTDPNCRVVSFDLEPGDVVAHHVMTLHGAPGNTTSVRRRRGLATRWCGDDAVFDPRPKTMPIPVDPGIESGAPMRGPIFPLIVSPEG